MIEKKSLGEQVAAGEKPFIIDEIVLVCSGCQKERKFPINPHMRSADEVTKWLKTKATACGCGATHCDAKLHLVNPS